MRTRSPPCGSTAPRGRRRIPPRRSPRGAWFRSGAGRRPPSRGWPSRRGGSWAGCRRRRGRWPARGRISRARRRRGSGNPARCRWRGPRRPSVRTPRALARSRVVVRRGVRTGRGVLSRSPRFPAPRRSPRGRPRYNPLAPPPRIRRAAGRDSRNERFHAWWQSYGGEGGWRRRWAGWSYDVRGAPVLPVGGAARAGLETGGPSRTRLRGWAALRALRPCGPRAGLETGVPSRTRGLGGVALRALRPCGPRAGLKTGAPRSPPSWLRGGRGGTWCGRRCSGG